MPVCLQQCDCCHHRRHNQHFRQRVRQHLLRDLFRLVCQAVVCNQCPRLLLGRRMASEQLPSPVLQRLDASVLVERLGTVQVF
jgi:hypothetical protein